MKTFLEVLGVVRSVAETHPQVMSFGNNLNFANINESEFEVFDTGDNSVLKYPCVFAMYQNGSFADGEAVRTLNILFGDLAEHEAQTDNATFLRMAASVQSEQESIAADFYAKLRLAFVDNNITVEGSPVITPFQERFKDAIAGVVMQIQVKVAFSPTVCGVPTEQATNVRFYFGEGQTVVAYTEASKLIDADYVVESFGTGHGYFWIATPTSLSRWRRSGIDFGNINANDLFDFVEITTINGDEVNLYVTNYPTDKDVQTIFK